LFDALAESCVPSDNAQFVLRQQHEALCNRVNCGEEPAG
jgi:hypothetical protein